VGVSIPEGIQDREDEVRANLKLKGNETIKTQMARMIAETAAAALHKKVDRGKPDLNVVVNLRNGDILVTSRPVFWYGRYTKPPGVSQKTEFCKHCSGEGCKKCKDTGIEPGPSVEGQLRAKFGRETGSERMRFTWFGSEDRTSTVYPPGRPFVVELKSPVRRSVPRKFSVRSGKGLVLVTGGKALPSRPVGLPSFKFRTEIEAKSSREVDDESLSELRRRFQDAEVTFERPHDRPVRKNVYSVKARKSGKTLTIDAVLDGGLPVKRFVSGELVSPSVSEVLKTQVRCRRFDILRVTEGGVLEFGKITWV
jgi:tRNA pseudouridine synthase 10